MKEIQVKNDEVKWKMVNLILIILVFISLLLMIGKVWYDAKLMVSPLLPKYTVIFANGAGINVVCFLIAGVVPAIFFRSRRHYLISTLCIIFFLVVGILLKDYVLIYEHFYELSSYL